MPANVTESDSRSWTPKAERDPQQVDGQQVSEAASPVDRSPMLDASMATSPGTEDEEPLSIKMPGRYRFRRFSMPTRPASFAANETFSSYFEALHDHLPLSMTYTLGNLRDALLGYLSEAESAVRDGLAGDRETVMASETPPSDERDTTARTATQAGITGLGLRRRGAALQRRLSGGIQAPAFPSSEALLAHLASIREDVAASLPEMPSISSISSLSTPSLPIPSMTAFLQTLPNRLHYLQEHLPATGQPDKERVARLVRSLLPSEDWAGWEKLGWDAGDDESDTGIVPNSEEEEPEYLFPNKTPRAAMNRMQSYAARSRSKSASYTAAALRQSRSLQELRTATSADLLRLDSEKGSVVLGDTDIEDLGSEQLDEEEMLLLQEQLQVSAQVGPTAQEVLAKSQHGKILIKYDDLPPWMQNNEFIVTGYR
jgi:adiponectin receptor